MIYLDFKLISISLSILISIIISFGVYLNNKNSYTNKTFFLFTGASVLWSIINYINYEINIINESTALLLLRFNIFLGLIQSFFLFYLFYIFPDSEYRKNKLISFFVVPIVLVVSFLIFTPFVFSKIISRDLDGRIEEVATGPGIIVFGILATSLVFFGLISIFKKYRNFKGEEKEQTRLILNGTFLTFSLIILFNLILPNVFKITSFTSFSGVFMLPFLILTSYSIIKYHLFNIKIIATELTVFILWIFLLTRTLMANAPDERIINGILFVIVVIIGLSLIKSVKREVDQRERLEILRFKLEESNFKRDLANDKLKELDKLKTEFLSLASHQLRSPLTSIKGYSSMILDGDYGKITNKVRDTVERVFQASNNLIIIVEDLLNVSKIESGGMQYQKANFDLSLLAEDISKDFLIIAEKKGIKLSFEKRDENESCNVFGDKDKIRQVMINFTDNAIKYTEKGSIGIKVDKKEDRIIFSVTDTGMGMSDKIRETLFHKFSRGDGARMNTSGSGLGLYLAKEITKAHDGKVWVESDGPGKGSTFYLELKAI